jgi:hypothetical protein
LRSDSVYILGDLNACKLETKKNRKKVDICLSRNLRKLKTEFKKVNQGDSKQGDVEYDCIQLEKSLKFIHSCYLVFETIQVKELQIKFLLPIG